MRGLITAIILLLSAVPTLAKNQSLERIQKETLWMLEDIKKGSDAVIAVTAIHRTSKNLAKEFQKMTDDSKVSDREFSEAMRYHGVIANLKVLKVNPATHKMSAESCRTARKFVWTGSVNPSKDESLQFDELQRLTLEALESICR
jgi:hypothetical protein